MGEGEGVRGVWGRGEGVGNTEAESGEVEAQHEGPGKGFDGTSLGEASRGQYWQQWQELQGPLVGLWLSHLQFSSPTSRSQVPKDSFAAPALVLSYLLPNLSLYRPELEVLTSQVHC